MDSKYKESEVSQIISNVLNAVDERNPLADALKKQYDFELSATVKKAYSFDYETRSMGATYKGGKTVIIGLLEHISIKNKSIILKKSEEYINQGEDVYVLGQNLNESVNDLDPIALIITKDHVRESMSHVELATSLGLVDYDRGAKIAGRGAWIYTNLGAQLEWALLNYFITTHLKDGYTFILPPHLLNEASGFGAGQFPKFREDVFWLEGLEP